MKTRIFLKTTALAIFIMLLSTFFSNAQIQLQGLEVDHEGFACWDANGSGPEPAATGHLHPYGWGSSLYYVASRDYDDIDPNPNTAMCHFTDNIVGFPLFVQALADNGFTAGQVKIKTGLTKLNNDIEGEDWFTFGDVHYINRYDASYQIELDGEPMVSVYINQFFTANAAGSSVFPAQSNYAQPWDASGMSSPAVQDVAAAFLADVDDQQIRLVFQVEPTNSGFGGNGRLNGAFFELVSGQLEKGIPVLPFTGLVADHQGMVAWNTSPNAPEPEAIGHTFTYGGQTWVWDYYTASRDYDDIDPDANAALCRVTSAGSGFPNLEIQLAYRGFTTEQLKLKAGISILGDDEEGYDWGQDGSIHWWHSYGTPVTLEIAGEPILGYSIDTNYSSQDLDNMDENWRSTASFSPVSDISANASAEAQYVALSLFKDIGNQSLGSYMEGNYVSDFSGNGRNGSFQQLEDGYFTLGNANGTNVAAGNVSGIWEAEKSPYMINGDLMVRDGQILEIEAGVTVAFRGPYHIKVAGCVKALGTADENILFTHSNPTVRWDGFDFDGTPASNDSSRFNYCTFEYAYAQKPEPFNSGGAIAVRNFDKLKFTNCIFQHNIADRAGANYNPTGGAMALWNSDPLIQNCIFRYNYSVIFGGAIFSYEYSNPVISGCLFYGNKSGQEAGAIGFYQNGGGILLNNTIVNNLAEYGGALSFWFDSSPEIVNTILWGNTATDEGNQVFIYDGTCTPGFRYCDIEDGSAGFGGVAFSGIYLNNLDEDPEFMGSREETPYALLKTSPCIDAGWPADWFRIPTLDIECTKRVCDGDNDGCCVIDMGAYEFNEPEGLLVTGIDEGEKDMNQDTKLVCFPNPFISNPIIEISLDRNTPAQLAILDLRGKIISWLFSGELAVGKAQVIWNTENIPDGIYFCRLQTADAVYTRKIVKMK